MGIDSMRVGGGRCPPLLVGGLLVACLMLICNWWTLSSENIELVRQIDELNEQLKISGEERDQCVTLRGNLEERFKHAEGEVASLHVRLEQQEYSKKKNEELEYYNNLCKGELDSLKKLDAGKNVTIETLRLEKNNFKTQLVTTRDENKKLQEEIEQIKDDLNKAKLNCGTTPPKKVANISQLETNPKDPTNNASNEGTMLNNPELEEEDKNGSNKQENTGSTDANLKETFRLYE
ncbi:uncharacterized protein LOC100879516 isoform X3 [Megachile rotundata]|uniref:uncharacterized protein LOC100879516 isoform X3 n=1 Tax=Megachile rotundata TaxID=143995 RepID=UPI000614C38C|nr:PREDICTED: Golgi membrane protein 1-like isoform X3 [Megachile rotundata]